MNMQRGKLVSGGRLLIPADMRRAMGLSDGDPVTLRVIDGELHVRPRRDSVARVRERLGRHIPPGSDLVGELIAERRAAARDE